MRDGIKFWRSCNDVILTRGENDEGFLPPKYITKAEDNNGNRLILSQNVPKEGEYTYKNKERPPSDLQALWDTLRKDEEAKEEAARAGGASVSAPASSSGLDRSILTQPPPTLPPPPGRWRRVCFIARLRINR